MSDKSSNSESTRSAAAIRQDIAEYVLKHPDEMSDVPGVRQFVEEHGRLTTEIAEGEERLQRLEKAKTEYEPLENRVTACRKALKDAEAELAEMHRPLGTAAFQSFLSGDLEDHPVFADRLAAHNRVQELHQQRDNLAPDADAGIALKAKAKAQQLAVMGKIKIEEMQLGGLETEVGRKAVEGNLDESVRCNSTTELLGKIAEQRGTVAECASKLREADALRKKAAKQLCEAVPLPHIESSKTFDTEIKACKATVRGSESALSKAMCLLTDELGRPHVTSMPDAMAQQIEELREASQHDVSERMRNAGDQMRKRGAGVLSLFKGQWSRLSSQGRKKVFAGACGVLLVLIVVSSLDSDSNDEQTGNLSDLFEQTENESSTEGGAVPELISVATIPTYDFSDVVYDHDFSTTDYESTPPTARLTQRKRELSLSEAKLLIADRPIWEDAKGYRFTDGRVIGHRSSKRTKTAYPVPTKQDVTRIQRLYKSNPNGEMVAKEYFKTIVPTQVSLRIFSSSDDGSSYQYGITESSLEPYRAIITLQLSDGKWALTSCSMDGETLVDAFVYHGSRLVFYDSQFSKRLRSDFWFHGKQHGTAKQWHENGQLALETAYVDGRQHGVQSHWHEDGRQSKSVPFVKGERHGVFKQWHANGQLQSEWPYVRGKKHGLSKGWHENGRQHNEIPFFDDKRHGTERWWHDNEQLEEESISSQDLLLSQRRWWPNGNKQLEVLKCKDGKYAGMVHEWHENGAEKTKGQYRSGNPVGTHEVFHDNGSLAEVKHFNDRGDLVGEAVSYYEDGTKQSEGVWENGKQNGAFKSYYGSQYDGRLQQDDIYQNGELQLRIEYYSNPGMGNGGIRATTNGVTGDYKIWNPAGELEHHSNLNQRRIIYQR